MILIALGQAHGSQFAPLVMRARGSVVCVGVRDAEKGPRAKCPPRAIWNGASGVGERFREPPIEWPPSRVAPRSVLALLEISLLRDLAWAEDFSNLYPTLGSCPNRESRNPFKN